jgi:hypothetical protein
MKRGKCLALVVAGFMAMAQIAYGSSEEPILHAPGLTQGEIFQYILLGVAALAGTLIGGHAGRINTKQSYVRALSILLFLPLVMYMCGSMVSVFIPDHKPGSFILGSIVFWYLFALPLAGVSAAFGWALTWLAFYLHTIVRDRK